MNAPDIFVTGIAIMSYLHGLHTAPTKRDSYPPSSLSELLDSPNIPPNGEPHNDSRNDTLDQGAKITGTDEEYVEERNIVKERLIGAAVLGIVWVAVFVTVLMSILDKKRDHSRGMDSPPLPLPAVERREERRKACRPDTPSVSNLGSRPRREKVARIGRIGRLNENGR
ncbi:hypothetical protein ElyMa_005445200 [Elysia marginata]|uniref:Transmembrane protein n=1 Tax=Elysia marginata TaxID=1093978 RepID=A0AAV4EP96_9GAST|nr:hypothetical protein ElyMa_005445200 [Elysia marginata]